MPVNPQSRRHEPVSIFWRRGKRMAGLTGEMLTVEIMLLSLAVAWLYDSTHDSRKNGAERRHH